MQSALPYPILVTVCLFILSLFLVESFLLCIRTQKIFQNNILTRRFDSLLLSPYLSRSRIMKYPYVVFSCCLLVPADGPPHTFSYSFRITTGIFAMTNLSRSVLAGTPPVFAGRQVRGNLPLQRQIKPDNRIRLQ